MQNKIKFVAILFSLAGFTAQPYLAGISWQVAMIGDIIYTVSLFTLGYLFNNNK